jgi:FkbM family methyltransferase
MSDFRKAEQLIATLRFVLSHPLNRGRPLSALGRFVAWQVAGRLRREVEFKWVEGAKLIVSRGLTGATGNIYCGLHEFVEMGFLLHLLRTDDLFLDIGANIGSYTILASRVCGARAIAFEPDPNTARLLRRNIAINHVSALAKVREAAVGDINGRIAFTMGLDTMNRVARPDDRSVQVVTIRRLDDISAAADPALIKLDVEGYEEQVLSGASRVLGSASLLAVQSELCSPMVRATLESFGFKRWFYDPFTRTLHPGPFGYRSSNALFVRGMDLVMERLAQAPTRTVGNRAL